MRRVRGRSSGFTLIEIIIALSLLAAVILLITRAFLTLMMVTTQGGNLSLASTLAAKKLEMIRTRVEARPDRLAWRTAFCQEVTAEPLTPFPAPYGAYAYRVLINEQAVAAAPGQNEALFPCWGIEWADGGRGASCAGAQYAPSCAQDDGLSHEERLRWVTVEIFFRGGAEPVVRMATAVIRGVYHR